MAKILKNIYFRPYIREGRAVRGYSRLVPVLPETHPMIFSEIMNITQDVPKLLKEKKYNEVEQIVLKIYKTGKRHFLDEPIFNREGLFTKGIEDFATIEKQMGLNMIDNVDNYFTKLTDKTYIKSLINRSQQLERFFVQQLKETPERINYFAFRFKQKKKDIYIANKLADQFNERITKRLTKVMQKYIPKINNIDFDPGFLDNLVFYVKKKNVSKKQFINKIGPTIFLQSVFIPENENFYPLNEKHVNEISEYLLKHNFSISDDPEIQRKKLKENISSHNELLDFLNKVSKDQFIPILNFALKHGHIPLFYMKKSQSKNITNLFKTFSGIAWNIIDPRKKVDEQFIYCSINPLDFLTASHDNFLDTCLSLVKDNTLNVTKDNVNIVQSYFLDKLSDFMLFIGNEKPKNQEYKKTARIFLTFNNKKKIENSDNQIVYSQNLRDREILQSFIEYLKQKNCLNENVELTFQKNMLDLIHQQTFELYKNWGIKLKNGIDKFSYFKRNKKNESVLSNINSIINKVTSSQNINNIVKKQLKSNVNQFIEISNTFNYGSLNHKMTLGNDTILMERIINNINKNITAMVKKQTSVLKSD